MNVGGDIDKANVSNIQTDEFKYPVIANALSHDGIYGYTSEYKDDSPCITVTGRGDVGCAKYRDYPLFPIVRLLVLHSKGKIDCRFGEHAINSIKKYEESTGVPQLTAPQLGAYSISFPNLTEQAKIGAFLKLIDERISTQNRIIDKLKSLMRGLTDELMDNPKWTKVYVGDFIEFFPTNSLSWEDLNYDNGQVRNLHYGLIHSGLPTLVDCQKAHLPYIQVDSLPKQYSICKDGDVALADASEDTAEVGKTVELTNIETQTIVCGLHTIHGRDCKDITVNGFKGFAFNSKYFHDQLRRIAQGSKVYSINTDNVRSCYLYIPTIAEQQKIVGLLRCMQEKIKVAEHGLQLYEAQKQFLLRGLFV